MYLKSIEIQNLKGFKKLEFDFTRPDGSYAGWNVVLGGNSSGKTTLLRSIAMCLMGPRDVNQMTDTHGWIRIGARTGSVMAQVIHSTKHDRFKQAPKGGSGGRLPTSAFPLALQWTRTRDEPRPLCNAPDAVKLTTANRGPWHSLAQGWMSAGYGPWRRLTGSSSDSMRFSKGEGSLPRFVSLFKEDAALSESEAWLKLQQSLFLQDRDEGKKELIEAVTRILGDGLLPQGMHISKVSVEHVFVKNAQGVELPLRDVSDGCRSIYATILDLIHVMHETYGIKGLFAEKDGRLAINQPGVVLIDEIEAHLHPSWQRSIPEWLKEHFPLIQFIVTSHSPLIAQAADAGGIFSLPVHEDSDQVPRRLPDAEADKIRLGRAEKTLLGVAFGLKASRSQWAEGLRKRWKELNALKQSGARLSPKEAKEWGDLRAQMEIVFAEDGE